MLSGLTRDRTGILQQVVLLWTPNIELALLAVIN